MNRKHDSATAVEEVKRQLESVPHRKAEIPPGDVVYWRAQARLAIEADRQRRRSVLQPFRVFHRAVAGVAIALGGLTSLWPLVLEASPATGMLAFTVLVALSAAGAYLLAETEQLG